MKQLHGETDSLSGYQGIHDFYGTQRFITELDTNLSYIRLVHILTAYFFNINFNIII